MIEGKAKAPEPEDMLSFVLKKFGGSEKLRGKKVSNDGRTNCRKN